MKKTLPILFILTLFTSAYPTFAECESDYNQYRIGRLPCPLVLKNCITIEALEENHYLPPKQEGQSESEYELQILNSYTPQQLQDLCKSCVVAQSKTSKCINRAFRQCRKHYPVSE